LSIYRFQVNHRPLNSLFLRIMFAFLACIIAIIAFIFMTSILFLGAIVGLIFCAIILIKNKFFSPIKPSSQRGRIIDVEKS
jgi:hypothetical protein